MKGYWGKIIEIDLSEQKINVAPLDEEIYRKFLGGTGIGAKLFLDRTSPEIDAFNPQNPLIIMTGPLTGTRIPGSATRFSIVSRSPLTGIWGEASCGGRFGNALKLAGYDGVIITGASENPVYLEIDDDRIEIKDASEIWGKDTYELYDNFKADQKGECLSIGIAGENLVKFASIMNEKGNAAGRCGLGAVMGSKKLKAIVAKGTKKVEFAEPEKLMELRKELANKIEENMISQSLTAFGSNSAMQMGLMMGDVPIKNWQIGEWEEAIEKLSGPEMSDTILTKNHACLACPVACKRVVKIDEGPYKMEEGPGPEYETVCTFGTFLLNSDLKAVSKANELCNRYGMDTISCGSTIAFAMECFDNGLISSSDIDGLELKWGNIDAVLKMVDKIARREGFGDTLAEGSKIAAEKIGGQSKDFSVTVKGLEAPAHDPRAFHGMGLAYAVSNRGACHMNSMQMWVEQGYVFYPKIGLEGPYGGQTSEEKAMVNVKTENIGSIYNSATLCSFAAVPFTEDDILNAINWSTGFNYSLDDLMKIGERIWMLKRGINILYGVKPEDDRLPKHILTTVEEGPQAGSVPDIDLMLKEFYDLRGLDEKGRPTKQKLEELGLAELAQKIY